MNFNVRQIQARLLLAVVLTGAVTQGASAVELSGLLDLRLVATDTEHSWPNAGLDKTRFDRTTSSLRLGQAFLKVDGDLSNTVSASIVFSAQDDRMGMLDVNEVWLAWHPVPTSAWKSRVKAGAFFPVTSVEIDYDSVGWTPRDTISSSAINSWIGEELRTIGIEYNLSRNGRMVGSPHDFGFTAAVFTANDPTGSLIAWRGWSVSDRITGLKETLPMADLPIFRFSSNGRRQTRFINEFRELDQRLGLYAAANYAYADRVEVAVMRYDNLADPMAFRDGQYGWLTRFNHISAKFKDVGAWEFSFQALQGDTLMGPAAVYLDFNAWFLLASRPLGPGRLAIRFDQFNAMERANDIVPGDPNSEDGMSLALAYNWKISPGLSLVSEFLAVQSNRPARALVGDPVDRLERSLTTSLRFRF
jgi:hypothetical protein